jgi:vacuolar-type H+-ATPase subunit I/STV1
MARSNAPHVNDFIPTVVMGNGEIGFKRKDVNQYVVGDILTGKHMERRAKSVNTDIEKATAIIEDASELFNRTLTTLVTKQNQISEQTKKSAGQVRDAANKLAEGIQRIEKLSNFDRLERMVALLERASVAMTALAELEKDGKLERIAASLK